MSSTRVGRARRRLAVVGFACAAAFAFSGSSIASDSPIADAMMRGDSAQLRALIKQGDDVNAAQADGMTALHWASSRGDATAAKMLVAAGARVDAVTRNGNYTPLHLAARNGRASATQVLLNAGANVNAVTSSGAATALHFAASNGDVATVDELLAKGAPVDVREGAWSQTPLMWAAAADRVDAISTLIKHGANLELVSKVEDISAKEKADRLALTARARRVAALKAAEAPVAAVAAGGGPAGGRGGAATPGTITVSSAAVAAPGPGAGSLTVGAKSNTPLPSGAPANDAAAMTEAGAKADGKAMAADAKKKGKQDEKAKKADEKADRKMVAAIEKDGAVIDAEKTLQGVEGVQKGADGKPVVATGAAPGASKEGAGAPKAAGDTTTRTGFNNRGPSYGDLIGNKGGLTALLFAVREGHMAAVNTLMMAGAKVNHVSDGDHTSPLLMATMNGYFDMAKMLLEKGADPKLASDANCTPLYSVINVQWSPKSLYPQPVAQQQQTTTYLELMDELLKKGADVNVRLSKHLWYMSYNFDLLGVNTTGATPFWRAAYGTDVDAMKLLVKYGADINIPTLKPTGRLPGDDAPADDPAAAGGKDPSGLPPVPDGGPGVYPIQAASGVGYGEGFAANSHRHAPDGWIPSMKYLIEDLHVDVNGRDFNGYTPLHHAAARGDNEAIKYLMSKGADINAISRRGQTVVDMANGPVQRVPPFEDTVEFLEKLGGKNSHKCKSC